MNNLQAPQKITLEDIALCKQKTLKEIRVQQERMTATARAIFAPLALAASTGNAIMRSFNTGIAIFDGVMLGIKIIKKLRGLLQK